MALKLLIPTIADKVDPAVERRAVYVEEWIEALPYANPGALVNALLDNVAKLNRNPVKPSTRVALMELYARPYQYLLELQEQHNSSRTVAAFEKHRSDSDAARRVAVEMAYGYKIVLADSIGKKSLFGKNKDLEVAVQRAMLFLSFTLLHCYDEYLPTPPHLWGEMWELYDFAQRGGIADQANGATGLRDEFSTSVSHLYKRILLSSLVDPYHLLEGEVWKVFSVVGNWSDRAVLGPVRQVDKPAGIFLVDSASNQRPVGYGSGSARISEQSLMLDATGVIEELQAIVKSNSEPTQRQQLGRVLRSLGLPPKRHSPRESTRGMVRLTSGITTLHYFLENATAPEPSVGSKAIQAPEVFSDEGIEIGDTGGDLKFAGPSYLTEYWEVADKGPGGVGVFKSERPNVSIGVGELIGVMLDPTDTLEVNWSIGVVRWLNVAGVGEYHIGIQLMARAGQPIEVLMNANGNGSEAKLAVALPRFGGDKSSTLICPKGCYTKGEEIAVRQAGTTTTIRANALVESAASFDRFTYELV